MRLLSLFVVVLVLGGLPGCAAGQGRLRLEQSQDALYDHPLEEVWPVVRAWFEDNGFRVQEDAERFVLQTEWREEFQGSAVAGDWHRYTVIGRRHGLSTSQVWIVHSGRSPDGAPVNGGRQPGWDIRQAFDPGDEGLPRRTADGESPPRLVTGSSVTRVVAALQSPAMASDVLRGLRNLSQEGALRDRLAPVLDARRRGAEAGALVAARQAPGGGSVECGPTLLGLAERTRPGGVLLLGEQHGTRQVPRFVALGACQVASRGVPLTVGLEWPEEEAERVGRFFTSAGTAEDRARLLEGAFWRHAYPDGRSSEAMVDLLERLRWLRAQGLDVQVFPFDHPGLQGEAREAAMARSVASQARAHPERLVLVLSGNIHPRTQPGVPWDPAYRPMGYLLSRELPSVLALDVAFADGTAWICSMGQRLECGVRPARGQDNGPHPFVSLFERPSRAGYHGVFYVGAISASPPAVRAVARGAVPSPQSSSPQ